ncbi:MAG: CDP-alcohol phosphatidyltransferase family protein [Pseudomonadota bacterium]
MSKLHQRFASAGWTEFMPADESDYILSIKRYMAFERSTVSFLTRQDLIQPNHITCFRFLICAVLLLLSAQLSYLHILILAALGAASDFFDGALARAASKKTRLGAIIDPLADKFLAFTLVYLLLTRKAIDPAYLVLMVLVESHLLLIPIFSFFYRMSGRGKDGIKTACPARDRGAFLLKAKEILMGKVKVFFYGLGFLTMLISRIFNSFFLAKTAEWLMLFGIVAGAIALFTYLIRWFKQPYGIS